MKETKIIGQDNLIEDLIRVFEIFKNSQCQIRPHFILTGPSGSGKSFTIKNLCENFEFGYLEINAAQITKEGTSGNSLSKALSPLLNFPNKPTVCFVDEFDKLFVIGNSNDNIAHESTTAVQNEFLKVLESDNTSVFGDYGKYINVQVKNVLFIFAGAFNGEENLSIDRLRELGLKTEFLGRVGLIFNTAPLTVENLFKILDNSELLKKYLLLFEDVDQESAVLNLKAYLQKSFEMNTLGARLINTLIHQYFIKKGNLNSAETEKVIFTKKLKLK